MGQAGSQKHLIILIILGFFIISPQLFHLSSKQQNTLPPPSCNDAQLTQVAKQHPYLLFHPIPINTADAKQFGVIPGIGPELSQRIIAYRTAHGPFRSLEELGQVNGIGPQKLATIKEYCRL
ncbi:MAG: helix-hairpin-helix domain-containing protein [Proteobacteria bacterium]|nr:helix-hairpin-helix domain-containing protein [Pseudomonadota bacterium]